MTPEGRIKNKINKVLASYEPRVYSYMPVPSGYGKATLDYVGFAWGLGFAIEAKRPGKNPTERQEGVIADMVAAGARVFRINSDEGVAELAAWLRDLHETEAWARGDVMEFEE